MWQNSEDPNTLPEPFEDIDESKVLEVLSQKFDSLVQAGYSASEAVNRLATIWPFEKFPALLQSLLKNKKMHDESDLFVAARNLAVDILRKESKRTSEQISEVGKRAAQAVAVMRPGTEINLEKLLAELRHLISVGVETATILDDDDPTGHKPWLPDRRADIKWEYWKRYSLY